MVRNGFKVFGVLLGLGAVGALLGRDAVVSVIFGWCVMGYLVWRAWPGVRGDWQRVRPRLRMPRIGRGRRQRGVTL